MLSEKLVEQLILLSEKIKPIIGEYIDIEFAVENGVIYILQARKITTLNGETPLVLDNSNIVESYPGVSLPLTISFVHMVYSGVFRGVCKRIVRNEKVIDQKKDVYNNMVGSANGIIYYKISNWYTVLKFLPFSKKIIPVWQEMLGVKAKSYTGEEIKIPFYVKSMSYVNFISELLSVPRKMEKLNKDFHTINDDFYARYNETMSSEELYSIFSEIKEKLFGVWDVTLINDMYAFIFTALLKSRLKKLGKSTDRINEYISGISDIESMKPMKSLIDTAYNKDAFSPEEYERAKKEYISKYGDRCLEELKLESKTFRTSPELFDERIDFYRQDRKRLEKLYNDLKNHGVQKEEKLDVITALLLKKASLGIMNREVSRFNRSRIYGIVRQIFLTVGNNAAKQGIINNTRDIFYLTVEELFDMPQNAKALIEQRKELYSLFEKLPAYTRLIFEKTEFDKNHASINSHKKRSSKNRLSGTPCSFGVAEGEACVITDIKSVDNIRGKILVTKMTDPGWVFLLASAKGIIFRSERRSHCRCAAATARAVSPSTRFPCAARPTRK
ncbi:MAG: phosphoenolpyruvate synthase, partial [Clostridia bacterium]|nr:phosphoenolpyruvate synthase [Clostridia bacterium]